MSLQPADEDEQLKKALAASLGQQPKRGSASPAAPKDRGARGKAAASKLGPAAAAAAAADGAAGAGPSSSAAPAAAGDEAGAASEDQVVSGNAYFLVYKCTAWQPPAGSGGAAPPAAAPPLESLPPDARGRVAQIVAGFEAACERHEAAKSEAERRVAERRAEVRSVLALAQAARGGGESGGGGPPGFLVPTTWLEAWANGDAPPGPVVTAPLACAAHGRLDPDVWQGVKYVSAEAWRAMVVSELGGGVWVGRWVMVGAGVGLREPRRLQLVDTRTCRSQPAELI
jgi:hypothetical protein